MAHVASEIRGNVGILLFNNPDGGFLTSEMVSEAMEKLDALRADDNVRTIVFTGALEDVFIRHFSVEEIIAMASALRENNAAGVAPERFALSALRAFWEKVDNCPKPTIAAINGVCGGGGCELALACDIRLAAKGQYTIGQMEILVGILPGAGGTVRLSRLVGPGKALEWVLRGKTFYPEEAAEHGLVNQLVEGDVLEAALDMAKEFDDKPPRALAAIKQAVRGSWGKSTLDGVLEEGDLFGDLIATDDQAVEMMENYVNNGHKFEKI